MQKLIVILGPTASGKSDLGAQLALRLSSGQAKKQFGIHGAEIISADSRQVYKGLDIGSGKITPDTKNFSNFSTGQAKKKYIFTHKGIPHYCIDVASPRRKFTVSQYAKLAQKAIVSVQKRGRVPFLVGGSPLYIYAVTDGWVLPEVKPNMKLRKQLEKLNVEQLLKKLQKLDPERAKTIEQKNPRRLIRALEIVMTTKKPVAQLQKYPLPYPILFLGIKKSLQELKQRIKKRFLQMLKRSFLNEIKALRKHGLSWKRIEDFGLEYREGAQYLQEKISQQEMIEQVTRATEDFARRQMTWFKKDQRIHWIKSKKEAESFIHQFLSN